MPRKKRTPKPPNLSEDLSPDSGAGGTGRVPAVTRAAAVLNAVATSDGLSLSDLARLVEAPKSSLLSVCLALTDERLLRRTEDGRYVLGIRVAELASAQLLHPPRLTHIAVAVQTLTNPFFAAEVRSISEICGELNIEMSVCDAEQVLAQQVRQLRAVAGLGIDALILDAVDSDGVSDAVASVRRSGIPVVAVNAGAGGADATVTTDNTQAGELIARHLAIVLNGTGNIAIVGGTRIIANADRISGFLSALRNTPRLRVVARLDGDNSKTSGVALAQQILALHPNVDAFFGINDSGNMPSS
jgi:ribose transport system substrate-binding protein